jgi:hypothetical protein
MNGNLITQTLRRPVISAYVCSENCSADEADVSSPVHKCTSLTSIIPWYMYICLSTRSHVVCMCTPPFINLEFKYFIWIPELNIKRYKI